MNDETEVKVEEVEVKVKSEEVEREGAEEKVTDTTKKPFKLGLFLKIAVLLLFVYCLIVYAWDNFLHYWWTYTAPQWLKTGVFWVIWLDVSWMAYKSIRNEEE